MSFTIGLGGSVGNPGTSSSLTVGPTTLVAGGGQPAISGDQTSGAGGVATGGQFNIHGGDGLYGYQSGMSFWGGGLISTISVPTYGAGSGSYSSSSNGNGGNGVALLLLYS